MPGAGLTPLGAGVADTFPFANFAQPRRANPLLCGALLFGLGLIAGVWPRPAATAQGATEAAFASVSSDVPLAHRLDPGLVYPAEVIRIIDGDTFEARVRVWPGLDVDTKVRLRGIDAAFDRYDQRPSKSKKVNSLAYCAQEVLGAAEDMKEAAVGAARDSADAGSDLVATAQAPRGFDPVEIGAFLRNNADPRNTWLR